MVECKDFRKGIIQLQWEHKRMTMQMEDLDNKSRDIRRIKLTEEQRDVRAVKITVKHLYWMFKLILCTFKDFTQKLQHQDFCPLYNAKITLLANCRLILWRYKDRFFLAASNHVWLLPSSTTDGHLFETHFSYWLYTLFFSSVWYCSEIFPNWQREQNSWSLHLPQYGAHAGMHWTEQGPHG